MAACHHCGTAVDVFDGVRGGCATCGTKVASFCAVCGWWAVGIQGIAFTGFAEATTALRPSAVAVCRDNDAELAAVINGCTMMRFQKQHPCRYTAPEYQYDFWAAAATWNDAVAAAVHWIDGFFQDAGSAAAKRMRAMLITYLSAWELCLRDQLVRLAAANMVAPLSLHDAPALAARHYKLHDGMGQTATVDTDCVVLRHVGTLEQCMKGNMTPSVAAYLLFADTGDKAAAKKAACEAALIHLAHLTVVAPYGGQTVPEKNKFTPTDNQAYGIYTRTYIDAAFSDMAARKVSLARKDTLAALLELLEIMPDFAGRPFRFNSVANAQQVDANARLSPNQKFYLKSLPDLDANDCPAACRAVVLAATEKLLASFMDSLGKSGAVTTALGQTGVDFSRLYDKANAAGVLRDFLAFAADGKYALQTSANDVLFIATNAYTGLWGLHSRRFEIGDVLSCQLFKPDPIVLFNYEKESVLKAADDRKKSPFQYMSWRVQKDRAAHHFFPMEPADYEVTAAVSQSFLVPVPQDTYGKQMVIWKPAIRACCTFKIRDSGRPIRGFLLLLHDLLAAGKSGRDNEGKTAILNLLVQLFRPDGTLQERFAAIDTGGLCTFLTFPSLRFIDVEAHVYAQLTRADVATILYPATRGTLDQVTQAVDGKVNHAVPVVYYDEVSWQQLEVVTDEQAGVYTAVISLAY